MKNNYISSSRTILYISQVRTTTNVKMPYKVIALVLSKQCWIHPVFIPFYLYYILIFTKVRLFIIITIDELPVKAK